MGVVVLLATLALAGAQPAWSAPPPSWSLSDGSGHRLALTLFDQSDPAFPPGWRLRLTARTPALALDHDRPVRIEDGLGGVWTLANTSLELVPLGATLLPAGAAQFDATDLWPRPSPVLPLRIQVPLEGGHSTPFTPSADLVRALHDLPRR